MWRLALAAVPVLALALVLVGGVASQTGTPTPSPDSSPSSSRSPSPSSSPSPEPSSTPEPFLPPPPPPDPSAGQPRPPVDPAYPGALRPGDWVQIHGTDSCLNMRWEPHVPVVQPDGPAYNNVLNCLPDGFIGLLDGNAWGIGTSLPVNADGRWWWHIVGQGWAADEFLAFHHQGGLPFPERQDLSNAGLIAYIGSDGGIWLMNADGSNPHPIAGTGSEKQYLYNLAWSPAGDQLSFSTGWIGDPRSATRIVDVNGNLIVELAGIVGARWSPDGTRLSALRFHSDAGLGANSTPVVFDLNAGTETAVGPPSPMGAAPVWSPDGRFVAFVCRTGTSFTVAPDGSSVQARLDCDGDGLRIAPATGGRPRIILPASLDPGGAYANPSWSPSGNTIAVYRMQADGGGCRGYILADAATGATGACLSLPPPAPIGGRCGGGPDMGASYWTPDGRFIFSAQGAGQSGVFVDDPASGARTVVPNMNAEPASLSPTGRDVTFGGGGYIWVAGLDGSNLTLLAEGHSSAWQPLR